MDMDTDTSMSRLVSSGSGYTTDADLSELKPPPLAAAVMDGAIHDVPAHLRTVLESMHMAVPLEMGVSRVGTKPSGLFLASEMVVPAGQTLFVTQPSVLVHSPDDSGHDSTTSSGRSLPRAAVCDYCFRGPDSLVEAEGGGYTTGPTASRCTGCNVLAFCGEACQHKAWRKFHQYECSHLRRLAHCDPMFLTHARLLLMDAAGCVPGNVMDVMLALTSPPALEALPEAQMSVDNCAMQTFRMLPSTRRNFDTVRKLLWRILGNQAFVGRADGSANILCFDIALAMLNHSCEPNAFAYVEGRQVRVRSLRRILPHEEITVALVDLRLDVTCRQEALKLQSSDPQGSCCCPTCKRDLSVLEMMTASEGGETHAQALRTYHTKVVPRAKQLMATIMDELWGDKRRELIHRFVTLTDGELVARLGKDMRYPGDYKPLPWLRMAAASMFMSIQDYENALYYAVTSFLFQPHRVQPSTVGDLRILVNTLKAICDLPPTSKQYRRLFCRRKADGDGAPVVAFPTREELGVFAVCCLVIYEQTALLAFGPKLDFVRALLYWGREVWALAMPLVPGTPEFNAMFVRAQDKLVRWCGRDVHDPDLSPLRPPTHTTLVDLRKVVEALDDKHVGNGRVEDVKEAQGWYAAEKVVLRDETQSGSGGGNGSGSGSDGSGGSDGSDGSGSKQDLQAAHLLSKRLAKQGYERLERCAEDDGESTDLAAAQMAASCA